MPGLGTQGGEPSALYKDIAFSGLGVVEPSVPGAVLARLLITVYTDAWVVE